MSNYPAVLSIALTEASPHVLSITILITTLNGTAPLQVAFTLALIALVTPVLLFSPIQRALITTTTILTIIAAVVI